MGVSKGAPRYVLYVPVLVFGGVFRKFFVKGVGHEGRGEGREGKGGRGRIAVRINVYGWYQVPSTGRDTQTPSRVDRRGDAICTPTVVLDI